MLGVAATSPFLALLAYRTSLHEATGFTPYHLVFGHSPQLPIDVMLGRVSSTTVQSFPQFVQQTHRYLKEAYFNVDHVV